MRVGEVVVAVEGSPDVVPWPHLPTLTRLGLALAVGLFVGLEREWRGKEAGLRTFGFSALLGALGGLLGLPYALLSLALIGVLVGFANWQALRTDGSTELTTSAALLVTGFVGVLCGLGHVFTPVAVAVVSAALLAWKEHFVHFSLGLTAAEVRSAILFGILTFVVYPILPAAPIDRWGLVSPQQAWVTVVLIAAIGFANYVLLKLYGTRGVELTGFLGGLVNSTVAVTELAARAKESAGGLADAAYRGTLLSTAAMALRNGLLLGLLAPFALLAAAPALGLMFLSSGALALFRSLVGGAARPAVPELRLQSPFSLRQALKFGLIFLVLQVVGTLAQRQLGEFGFYAVSVVGGVVSSASAVAAAGTLAANGALPPMVAGAGAVVASLASVATNLVLVERVAGHRRLTRALALALSLVTAAGLVGAAVAEVLLPPLFGARVGF